MDKREDTIRKLGRRGYIWKYYSRRWGFDILSKKEGSMTKQVEVDVNGLCNGVSLSEYLAQC